MSNFLISIIIPCYNSAKYIDRCLTSIFSQSIGINDIQVICVDDHSSDNTLSKLKEWEIKYPDNITIIACEHNGRQGTARNIGLNYAEGQWISYIDSDDWVSIFFFEKLLSYASEDTDIITCGHIRDAGDGRQKESIYELPPEMILIQDHINRSRLLQEKRFGGVWPSLIRHDYLLDENIFYPEGVVYEDLYTAGITQMTLKKGVILKDQLYHYFVNDSSTVLKRNDFYHLDYITVMNMLWKEWENRGFFDEYSYELTAEYLLSGFIGFLKIIIFRFDDSQYSLFRLLKTNISALFDIYDLKKWVISDWHFTELQKIWLRTLWTNVDKESFEQMMNYTRSIGSI